MGKVENMELEECGNEGGAGKEEVEEEEQAKREVEEKDEVKAGEGKREGGRGSGG